MTVGSNCLLGLGLSTDFFVQEAGAMIRHMIESGESNTYQIIRHGKHKLLHQAPWYDAEGNVAGLIELAIDLPEKCQYSIETKNKHL